MEALLLSLDFAPLIGAAQLPSYIGQGIGGSGPWLELPLVVVVVVGAVDPRMIMGRT